MNGEPQVLTPLTVLAPLTIGHTWDANDDTAAIFVNPLDTVDAVDLASRNGAPVETRCSTCRTQVTVVTNADGETTSMLVLEHERSCTWLRRAVRGSWTH